MNHILSELSTIARPSWMALYGMDHSFIELDKAVIHMIILVIFSLIVVFILEAKGL